MDHVCSIDLVSDAQTASLSWVTLPRGQATRPVPEPWGRGLRQELPESARQAEGDRKQ